MCFNYAGLPFYYGSFFVSYYKNDLLVFNYTLLLFAFKVVMLVVVRLLFNCKTYLLWRGGTIFYFYVGFRKDYFMKDEECLLYEDIWEDEGDKDF